MHILQVPNISSLMWSKYFVKSTNYGSLNYVTFSFLFLLNNSYFLFGIVSKQYRVLLSMWKKLCNYKQLIHLIIPYNETELAYKWPTFILIEMLILRHSSRHLTFNKTLTSLIRNTGLAKINRQLLKHVRNFKDDNTLKELITCSMSWQDSR